MKEQENKECYIVTKIKEAVTGYGNISIFSDFSYDNQDRVMLTSNKRGFSIMIKYTKGDHFLIQGCSFFLTETSGKSLIFKHSGGMFDPLTVSPNLDFDNLIKTIKYIFDIYDTPNP